MATTQRAVSRTQVERELAAVVAGQRMAGAEPSPEDLEVGRRILTGEVTADDAVRQRFAQLEQQYGFTR